eukprot:gene24336-45060_t
MGEPGKAMMGTAKANGPDRARIAAEQAVACPLLEGIDLSGAKGVLVLISAAKGSLKLSESKQAMNTIRAYASPDAHGCRSGAGVELKDPRLFRFVLAHFLTVIGEWTATVGVLVYAYDWGGSSAVGLVSLAVLAPPLCCAPIAASLTA